jgi:hypothetical protein
MFTLCHPIADMCVNAPPTRLPNLVPFALTQPIMFTARLDALPVHFVLHDSGRTDLPLLPGVIHPPCDRLRSMRLMKL